MPLPVGSDVEEREVSQDAEWDGAVAQDTVGHTQPTLRRLEAREHQAPVEQTHLEKLNAKKTRLKGQDAEWDGAVAQDTVGHTQPTLRWLEAREHQAPVEQTHLEKLNAKKQG